MDGHFQANNDITSIHRQWPAEPRTFNVCGDMQARMPARGT
jgi:hypothetical protein